MGPNHYVNTVNSSIKIFDKSGNPLNGTNGTTFNSFFSSLTGTPCANSNDGDPFTFYDHQADRWVISDFAFPAFPGTSFWQCVGVSQSPDPVAGPWALYAIQIDPANSNQLGDYPKFSMWNDGGTQNAYFFTVNLFTSPTTFVGTRAFALDRTSMLAGGPANAIAFTIPIAGFPNGYSLVPATFRTGDPPPAGRDEIILAIDSPANENTPLTQVHGWKFHVDFANPGNSTLGVGANHSPNAEITTSPFVEAWTNAAGFTIVPQEGTTNRIQTLGDRMMTPVVYQNRSGTESLWADYTTIINFPSGPTTVRWYQFDVTGGNFPATPVQQQDWSNGGDGLFRFMPSIAVDQSGNAAIGYSVSSSTTFPGIRYAGRLVSDPPSNMGQGEATMFNGTGSQTSGPRWGDYSYLSIDPVDNMSFWHVNEYLAANGAQWHQRIGKFDFVGGPNTNTNSHTNSHAHSNSGCLQLVGWAGFAYGDWCERLAFISRTATFTPWVAVPQIRRALTSSTCLNTTPRPTLGHRWLSTLPDNQMNNMACGVLTVSGTPLIYCVGGSAAGQTTATARVFPYDPATDTPAPSFAADDWPGDAIGTILPGGFTVANNKFYILGGFNINVASTNEIWEFDPNAASGSRWTQKVNTPEGIMYAPTCTINRHHLRGRCIRLPGWHGRGHDQLVQLRSGG